MTNAHEPHSAAYIGDHRLEWWNADHVALLAQRLDLRAAESVLDVGAGAGHWSAVLVEHLPGCRRLICLDGDPHWARLLAQKRWREGLVCTPVLADAHRMPLPSNSVDIATCQTLLMHCASPLDVLKEMLRVTKDGGHLLIVEPVNLLNRFVVSHALRCLAPVEQGKLFQVLSCMHLGQSRTGMCDHDIAVRIPDMLDELGAVDVSVCQNDKVWFVNPQEIVAVVAEMDGDVFAAMARAGGASDADLALARRAARKMAEASIASGRSWFSSMNTYVFHARKRPVPAQ